MSNRMSGHEAPETEGFVVGFIAMILAIGLCCFMVKVIADRQVARNLDRIATVLEKHDN